MAPSPDRRTPPLGPRLCRLASISRADVRPDGPLAVRATGRLSAARPRLWPHYAADWTGYGSGDPERQRTRRVVLNSGRCQASPTRPTASARRRQRRVGPNGYQSHDPPMTCRSPLAEPAAERSRDPSTAGLREEFARRGRASRIQVAIELGPAVGVHLEVEVS